MERIINNLDIQRIMHTINSYRMVFFMNIEETKEGTVINEVKDFNITQTLECGQCFHFKKFGESEYGVVHKKELLHIYQDEDRLFFENTDMETLRKVWLPYFDLDRDYSFIKQEIIRADGRLKEAVEVNSGVRILNQGFEETLMSFIISQNKQIPHIKKIVREISEKYGNYLGIINGESFYSFPNKEQLRGITIDDYRECKTGFRAAYLYDAAQKLREPGFSRECLRSMGYDEAKKRLMMIKGVGEKVANCVLLFALGYRNAFPVDVWIKRIMENMYFGKDTDNKEIMGFAKKKFGEYGGYAQQYLFYYARTRQIGK